MDTLKRKYANFLLTRCLSIEKGEPLLFDYNIEHQEFADIVKEEAKKLGIYEIYEIKHNEQEKREFLINHTLEEIQNDPYFDRSAIKEVYDKGGSLLCLRSYYKSTIDDIEIEKRRLADKISIETQKDSIEARSKYKYPWCAAAVATKAWADELFPNEENSLEKLWNIIFDITLMNNEPIEAWNKKIENNNKRRDCLNKLMLKKLKYKNSLGTDLELELPDNVIWWGSGKKRFDGKKDLITNVPTEEVYTSPLKYSTNGVVYSSKPLVINGITINKLRLTFKEGKLIDAWASNNLEKFLEIIDQMDGMRYLGECALVDYDSPISNTNMLFKLTLIDENASCHLALGDAFPKTIPNGENLTCDELSEKGINRCNNHEDFMIGTPDLEIIGTDIYGNNVPIFVDGNFAEEKIKVFLKERNI